VTRITQDCRPRSDAWEEHIWEEPMGLVDFRSKGNKHSEEEAPQAVPQAESQPTTHLGRGCRLSGRLRFPSTVHIEGRVEGEIESLKAVIVGESARVRATVRSESVVIRGHVKGDVVAKRKITLHSSAHVNGDMRTAGIVVEEGAKVEGRIVIGSDEESASAEKTPAQKRPRETTTKASEQPPARRQVA
jgi:cytoskeletal protein CcmA (bactofilin family)